MNETYAQRMRVWFRTDDTVKYVGHLDMHRAWERAIRRARLPLAYTQGFNPQARLQFAAALPVGFTGQGEVADVFLNEELRARRVRRAAGRGAPARHPARVAPSPSPRELPSLQSQVYGATLPRRGRDRRRRRRRSASGWPASSRGPKRGASGARAKMSRATTCAR